MIIERVLTTIGIILTILITFPLLAFSFILSLVQAYEMKRDDPNRPPPSKDEWKQM